MPKIHRKLKKICAAAVAAALTVGSVSFSDTAHAFTAHTRVSVHDPSVVVLDDGSYYIIGSHLAAARSTDLCSWTYTADSQYGTTNTTYFDNIYTDLAIPESWSNTTSGYDLSGNLWAPDIIYNPEMEKYCMYLSVNGENWNSSIVLCTADEIDGPYTYQGTIVYSGFTNGSVNNVNDTDVPRVLGEKPNLDRYLSNGSWDASYGTNAIDPCVFYDENGSLWMIYGSWFGGVYMLELDESTGLRDYSVTYETVTNVSDAYLGKKAAGGYYTSGEGPYIAYLTDETGKGYYYLFLSYGYYNANGGYNIRVFRSENPDGPYLDENGNSAIYTSWGIDNIGGTVGERLMSNYQWDSTGTVYKAQGHNSAFQDSDGKIYLIYHTKFDDDYGFHEVRVHQMFLNEDGWLTVSPYEYSGETISESGYSSAAVTGEYQFIFHTLNQSFVNEVSADVETPKTIYLNEDGTVTGEITGTWSMESDTPYMALTFDGVTYRGEFLVQADESAAQTQRITFTATGNNTCVWGSKSTAYDAALDGADMTDTGRSLTYNPGTTSYENGGTTLCGTELLSDISYLITSKSSGKVLERNGSNVQQWESNGWNGQEWRLVDVGDGYCKIVSLQDETLAVTVEGDAASGSNIGLSTYTGSAAQQWKLVEADGGYGIVSRISGDSAGLDVYAWSEENGGNIDQWEYWAGDCQIWSITPVYPAVTETAYQIRSKNSGLFLASDAENLIQSENASTFVAEKNTDGTYTFTCNGLAVTVESADATDGSNVILAENSKSESQRFWVLPCADGSYAILSACSAKASCLDVYEISPDPGANICQWTYWGGDGQKWILIPTEEPEIIPTETTEISFSTEPTETAPLTETEPAPAPEPSTEISTETEPVASTETETEPVATILYGDVTLDGKINVADVVLLAKAENNYVTLSSEQFTRGDCDLDGAITSNDMILIMNFQIGTVASLPLT